MSESILSRIDTQRASLKLVANRLKREITNHVGGAEAVANEFSRRTNLVPGSARDWISLINTDLHRKLTSTTRGTANAIHLHRLGVLMNILNIKPDDEIVPIVRDIKPDFVYPPEETAPVSHDKRVTAKTTLARD